VVLDGKAYLQRFSQQQTITGNTYVGKGDGNWLDYAIEIGRNSTATTTGNTISSNTGVATVDGSTSAGIIVTTYYDVAGTHSGATITDNTITGNTDGIAVGYDEKDVSVVVANHNNISGNTDKAIISTNPTIDATNNWWGSADPNFTSVVSENVTYSPWWITSTGPSSGRSKCANFTFHCNSF